MMAVLDRLPGRAAVLGGGEKTTAIAREQTVARVEECSPERLQEAFAAFISASARLEISYRDLQGEVQQLSRELAERNAALKESLRENRAMRQGLEQTLRSMPCGVLVVEADGAIVLVNVEAARLLAMPAERMRSLEAVRAERGLDLALGGGDVLEDAAEQELALRLRSGEERWLAVRRQALGDEAAWGGRRRAVLMLQDVSSRRRMEAAREAAREAVTLAEVSAMLAHEIRNPLASMELFTGLMEDCPERAGEWVGHLQAGVRGLAGTVNNVLTLHGGVPPAMEPLELREEMRRAVEFVRPMAMQAGVRLEFAGGSEPIAVRANRSALGQIVLNLSTNALRHTEAGGALRVAVGRRGECAVVTVADTGAGMPAEMLPRLFAGRFSGSGSTSGLGLAVCGRLMAQHGGRISVRSEAGVGSVFEMEFPRA